MDSTQDLRRLMGENKQKKEKPVRRALVLWGEGEGVGAERFALASQMKTAECEGMVKNALVKQDYCEKLASTDQISYLSSVP